MDGVGVGEDVMGSLPVGVLVGTAEARHPERGCVGEATAEVGGSGPRSDRRLQPSHDLNCIVAEEQMGKRRMIRPAPRTTTDRE